MADHLDDIERVEQIKNWLSKYAAPIIIGVILGLAVIYGLQFWQQKQLKQNTKAAELFQQVSQVWVNGSDAQKESLASQLVTQFPKTVYADFANLGLAELAVNQQDYAKAASYLDSVVHQGRDPGLREIAKIRLARVLAAEGKIKDGLDLLAGDTSQSFAVLVKATQGDLYLMQHNNKAASQAYQQALAANPEASQLLPLIPYQLQQLHTTGEKA